MRFDPPELGKQRVTEFIRIGKSRKPGDAIELLPLVGNDMGLRVADHLQPVLDAAQEKIGLGKLACRLLRNPAAPGEALERLDRTAGPELGMTAAGDELLGLGGGLDVAGTAPPAPEVGPPPRAGPEPEIGAEHIAVGSVLLEETHEIAGQPHEED